MTASSLPVLPLPHPLILLPGARTTLFLSAPVGETLLSLLHERDPDLAQPVIGAVPVLPLPENAQGKQRPKLCEYGVAARAVRLNRAAPSRQSGHPPGYTLTLVGLARIRLPEPVVLSADLEAHPAAAVADRAVEYLPNKDTLPRASIDAFKTAALNVLDRLARDGKSKKDTWLRLTAMVNDMQDARVPWMADVMVSAVAQDYQDKLDVLCMTAAEARVARATELCVKQASILEVSNKITTEVNESLSKQQKEFYLRQQLAAIQKELSSLHASPSSPGSSHSELDDDEQHDADDLAELKTKIEALGQGSEERKMAVREWRRMKRIQSSSVEHGVIRSYLEWLVSVPWPNATMQASEQDAAVDALREPDFLQRAREQLDSDHFGLDKIKRRLIEYLAVVRLKALAAEADAAEAVPQPEVPLISSVGVSADVPVSSMTVIPAPSSPPRAKKATRGPILLFVGPPGVGKTSLGQSVARALRRPFGRISLGGVRDEAEIRGHRRTYVASGPGSIVQALRKAGRSDMVLLLDEIDKVGHSSVHGDPSAALLEVLDPEQNGSFNDHYMNVPIDLSQVLFICTSNTLETIPAPLLDRCEIIQLSGYTHAEKLAIARRFLLPKQLTANALDAARMQIEDPVLRRVVEGWTREAGVRSLERAVGAVVRYKAVQWAERGGDGYQPVVEEWELEKILGPAVWSGEEKDREERVGVVWGLVVSGLGEGSIMPVESRIVPGSGRLKLTGSLGEVIKESAELALSWVKAHAFDLYVTKTRGQDPLKGLGVGMEPVDIHLHLPAGAQKKDGPSAGVAMTCALVSLLTGVCVPPNVAMTGEITLRGRVTPVGGIKEKVLGAHRAQVTKVILPYANRKDVEHDVTPEVRSAMNFVFVRTVEEALEAAFGNKLRWRAQHVMLESRL